MSPAAQSVRSRKSRRLPAQPLPGASLPSLHSYLERVPDPRSPQGRRHPLAAVLTLICLAMLSGIHGYLPASEWLRAMDPRTKRALGFTHAKTPVASTFYEVLKVVPWRDVEEQIRLWSADVFKALRAAGLNADALASPPSGHWPDPDALAMDGKTMRGSWKRGADMAHMLAVVGHQLGVTLAQLPIPRKKGEAPAARELLNELALTGLVVTMDAQFTQRKIAEKIQEQGGDYLMRVKGNQSKLLREVEELFSPGCYERSRRRTTREWSVQHGRVEQRSLTVITLREGEVNWPGARQVYRLRTRLWNLNGTRESVTVQYGITSLSSSEAEAKRLLRLSRGHWSVENQAFWVRDVVFREDASSVKTGNIVASLATLRGAVLTLIRAHGHGRIARTMRVLNADRRRALRLLGCC